MNGRLHSTKLSAISLSLHDRQIDYYLNSARYLGLVKKKEKKLTRLGQIILQQDFDSMILLIAHTIMNDTIFNDYFNNRDLDNTVKLIMKYFPNININTASRRANNVKSWIKTCEIILNEQDIKLEGIL
jgi:hypothetical protein